MFAQLLEDELRVAIKVQLDTDYVRQLAGKKVGAVLKKHGLSNLVFQAAIEKKIDALTPDQVVEALRKHFDPEKFVEDHGELKTEEFQLGDKQLHDLAVKASRLREKFRERALLAERPDVPQQQAS